MPWQKASPINLSEGQKNVLIQLEKGSHTPMHLKQRAKIILMAEEGATNNEIERALSISSGKVKTWRDRFSKIIAELNKIESESPHKLRTSIKIALSDEQRSGAPAKFTEEQVAAILALSCDEPTKLGLPFSHWTPELLQIEVIKRGIVQSISVRQIGRFLKRK